MGIRGTVRRSNDSWFAHCNVDTDVVVWEGDARDPALKPPELQSLIENFCQGTRRLHLWGSPRSLRRGWLTVGEEFEEQEVGEGGAAGGKGVGGAKKVVRKVEREETKWDAVEFASERYRDWFAVQGGLTANGGGVQAVVANGEASGAAVAGEPTVKVNKLLPFVEGKQT